MRWKAPNNHYAKSDKGYSVAKGYVGVDNPKYIAYAPNGKMLDHPAFFSFKEARMACEEHHNIANQQTNEDMF